MPESLFLKLSLKIKLLEKVSPEGRVCANSNGSLQKTGDFA
jgi:hypothetical protein